MTEEEMLDKISELEAERDSLKEEIDTLTESLNKSNTELADTKKANFTLIRKLDSKEKKPELEELLNDMFKKG